MVSHPCESTHLRCRASPFRAFLMRLVSADHRSEGPVLLGIYLACLRATPPTVINLGQTLSGPADPTDPTGRHACYQREVGHVSRHHGAGGDQGPAADRA